MDQDITRILAEYRRPDSLYHLPTETFRALLDHQLYQERKTKKLIYADLNFWINFRDALQDSSIDMSQNSAKHQRYRTIHSLLGRLVEKKKIKCVLSSTLLEEMSKMSHDKQLATARVMDGLQCRTVLNNYRIALGELHNVANLPKGRPPFELYYLSSIFEANPMLSEKFFEKNNQDERFFQNVLYADTMNYSVETAMTESIWMRNDSPSNLAATFNHLKSTAPVPSYRQLVAEGLESQVATMRQMFQKAFSFASDLSVTDHIHDFKTLAPFQYLLSSLYAAIAVDKDRKMKVNDYYDTMQSCVAVPYADYFFTEKSFNHLLISKPVEQLDSYKAVVESDLQVITSILEDLLV